LVIGASNVESLRSAVTGPLLAVSGSDVVALTQAWFTGRFVAVEVMVPFTAIVTEPPAGMEGIGQSSCVPAPADSAVVVQGPPP
jgi:hypothetical protein